MTDSLRTIDRFLRLSVLSVCLALAAGVGARPAGLTLADLEPVKGDSGSYKITEEVAMAFEGTPVKMLARGAGTQTSEVVATGKGGNATVYVVLASQVMRRTRAQAEGEEETTSYTLEVCRTTPRGVYVDANIGVEDGEDDSVDVGKTILQMRLPCQPGTAWYVGRLTYKDGLTIRPRSRATGYETVEVPAGTFENCLKVVSTCPSGLEGSMEQDGQRLEIISSDLEATTWYCPQVGIVKEVLRSTMRLRPEGQEHSAVLRMDTATVTELTEYRLGERGQ